MRANFATVHCNPVATAEHLSELDKAMRRDVSRRAAIAARFRFYEQAVRLYAIRRLNTLGDLVPRSRLSERSLDVIFEDDRYALDVIKQIVVLDLRDKAFHDALVEQEGAAQLAYWRTRAATAHGEQLVA